MSIIFFLFDGAQHSLWQPFIINTEGLWLKKTLFGSYHKTAQYLLPVMFNLVIENSYHTETFYKWVMTVMTISFYIKFMSKKACISPEIHHKSNKHEIYIFNSHVMYNLVMNDTKRLVVHEITTYFDKLLYLFTLMITADSGNIIFSRT